MHEIIFNYIVNLYGKYANKNRIKHYSYCLYPEEDCSCKYLKEITFDTDLITGGYLDSFEMVAILVFLENTFKIKISEKDATPSNMGSINKMVALIKANGAKDKI